MAKTSAIRKKANSSSKKKNKEKNKKKFNFNKTADYSKEKTKGNFGSKIAKAITPDSLVDVLPVGKALKIAKIAYKYIKQNKT